MEREQIRKSIEKWVPDPTFAEVFADWVMQYRIKVVVTRSRKSKRGTYMPPQRGNGHKITINNDQQIFRRDKLRRNRSAIHEYSRSGNEPAALDDWQFRRTQIYGRRSRTRDLRFQIEDGQAEVNFTSFASWN